MIDFAYGVIQISNKCSCLEIFDQQGNLNLTPLLVISYHNTMPTNYYDKKKILLGIVYVEQEPSARSNFILWSFLNVSSSSNGRR